MPTELEALKQVIAKVLPVKRLEVKRERYLRLEERRKEMAKLLEPTLHKMWQSVWGR